MLLSVHFADYRTAYTDSSAGRRIDSLGEIMTRSALLDIWDEAELKSFAPNDYRGLSYRDDLVLSENYGGVPLLFSAPHATKQVREGDTKEEDQGTGGLAEVLARLTTSTYVAMGGSQTGDPNWDIIHPYKDHIKSLQELYGLGVLFDLHGIGPETVEKTGAHIGVGLGPSPSPASGFIAQSMKSRGEQIGIEVRVGNSSFAALRTNSITATATRNGLIAVQLELAPHLRFGEGNNKSRLLALRLIYEVALDVVSALPRLHQLAHQVQSLARSNQHGREAVMNVARKVQDALDRNVEHTHIYEIILEGTELNHSDLELFYHEDLYGDRLGSAGELMRGWVCDHAHALA